ncbi:MAG: F0F1 ATP synthase subunit A [Rubrobacteraceae bacterium]
MSTSLTLAQLNPEELREEITHAWSAGQYKWVELSLFGIDISITKAVVFLWIGAALTFLLLFIGARLLKDRPGAYQVIVEEIYGFGRNSLGGLMGEEGKKWFPYTLSLFLFLLILNLTGLVPNSFPVTSSISFTLTLALLTFALVQIEGVRHNGLGAYVKAFVPPNMPAKPIMVPFMFLIEWISELSKPLTLAMRLYANILAGHLLIFIFLSFILYAGGTTSVIGTLMPFFSVPAALVLYGFEIFVAILQAYIFAILTQIYIEIAIYRQEH